MRSFTRRTAAALLSTLLLVHLLPASAFAAQENTPKEEVVYINLLSDGTVKEINVVNIFDLDETGQIVDYGDYASVRNMTTTDAIGYENGVVTIGAGAGKLYYEGRLNATAMPWRIAIGYFLDGEELPAQALAGRSGDLEIRLSIRKNLDCPLSFFEGYGLQVTLVLDTKHARNIVAEGATLANVGSKKQITYTLLPNSEKDIVVKAHVDAFEMEGIAINGIRMNLDINVDATALQGRVGEIIAAVKAVDEGAGSLRDGVGTIHSASMSLNTAAGELNTSAGALRDGAATLESSLTTLSSQSAELTTAARAAYEALCSAAQAHLNALLAANGLAPVTLTPETYAEVLQELLSHSADAVGVDGETAAAIAAIQAQLDQFGTFCTGLGDYTSGVSTALEGASTLSSGLSTLTGSTSSLKRSAGVLNFSAATLKAGAGELKSGTERFVTEVDGMDAQLGDTVNHMISAMTGKDVETGSFVSPLNTHVKAVQFVIRTAPIALAEAPAVPEPESEPLTLWQKLVLLFK
ncbi:MAG: hypothetical protein PUC00_04060 [Clostridiales bacterium]|nr:hypothetical protein [Clostridiales bacterium]